MEKKEDIDTGRRSLFALAALPLLAVGLGARARAAATPATPCYNPATLTAFQKNQRIGLKYRVATDPQKKCGGCMYFAASTEGCGKCQLLLNGPVAAGNVCDGWTKKS